MSAHIEQWPLIEPFRITGHVFTHLECLIVEILEAGSTGRGEASGVYYLQDTPAAALEQIMALSPEVETGMDRQTLQTALPPGGARNALDCALWDLECKLDAQSVWSKLGFSGRTVTTCQTIGILPTPDDCGSAARAFADYSLLKLKLDGDRPIDRVRAVRSARADARIIVDANQGFTLPVLQECLPEFAKCGVEMIEQPLPRGDDASLEGLHREVPICADESCLHRGELNDAARRYDMVNIKLDKAGGLTEGLLLADDILQRGLGVMVGNMFGTSLAMAPAFVVAQKASLADLDGPLALKLDRLSPLAYAKGRVEAFTRDLWG